MIELLVEAGVYALLGLACIGGLVWTVTSGQEVGVGRIFLAVVSLLLGLLFFGMAAWVARGPLRDMSAKNSPKENPVAEKAAKPQPALQNASRSAAEKTSKPVA